MNDNFKITMTFRFETISRNLVYLDASTSIFLCKCQIEKSIRGIVILERKGEPKLYIKKIWVLTLFASRGSRLLWFFYSLW